MMDLNKLSEAADLLLEKAKNSSLSDLSAALQPAIEIGKLSLEAEKTEAEVRKIQLDEDTARHQRELDAKEDRANRVRDYVAWATPVLTIVTLAATLGFQAWQFAESEKDKTNAAEEDKWQAAVTTISTEGKLSRAVIVLNPYLKSLKHAEEAKQIAKQLLINSSDTALFDDIFGAAYSPLSWSDLDEVLDVNRALRGRSEVLSNKCRNPTTDIDDEGKLSETDRASYDYVNYALTRISSQVGTLLNGPHRDISNLDFSGTRFQYCDWRGSDLTGVNCTNTEFFYVTFNDASLGGITQFDGIYLWGCAWWRSKTVSPALLKVLQESAAYSIAQAYGPNSETITPGQYQADLDRLKAQK
jgi:hypothetical protein